MCSSSAQIKCFQVLRFVRTERKHTVVAAGRIDAKVDDAISRRQTKRKEATLEDVII